LNTAIRDSYTYTDTNLSHTSNDMSLVDTWWYGLGVGFSGPYVGLEGGVQYIDHLNGLDSRWLSGKVNPFGKIRIGYEDSWYYTLSYLSEGTYLTSGGILQTGFSLPIFPETLFSNSSIWLGYGAGPWDASNLIACLTIVPNSLPISFIVSGSYNIIGDVKASSLMGGIRYSFK